MELGFSLKLLHEIFMMISLRKGRNFLRNYFQEIRDSFQDVLR